MIDNYNPDTPTENDLINEYARSSLEDWHDEEWAERDKAAARRRIAKIKADAWDDGAIAAATELDGQNTGCRQKTNSLTRTGGNDD